MDPRRWRCSARRRRSPRACGDGPVASITGAYASMVSPRLRGWTLHWVSVGHTTTGLPAPAGMDPVAVRRRRVASGSPRACGDGPLTVEEFVGLSPVSPRLRGWTRVRAWDRTCRLGFPAPAGMDRCGCSGSAAPSRFPRACGDGPTAFSIRVRMSWVSPRLRGWTRRADDRGAFLSAPIAELSRSRGPLHYVCPTNSDPCRSHGGRRRPTTHAAPRSSYQSAPKVSRK